MAVNVRYQTPLYRLDPFSKQLIVDDLAALVS